MPRQKKGADGLTDKQREYTRQRAAGKSQIEAYALAGYSTKQSKKSQRENACHLDAMENIQKNIERLQKIADNGGIMSTETRKAALYEIYQDSANSTKDRLKALDLLNRMSGDYVDKKEITANVGITRADRMDAMRETLESLKKAWESAGGEE